jgi:hypothetical protein
MKDSESWRLECEAREHLKRTQGEPDKIKALLVRIKERRGQEAADRLRDAMRLAYQAARRTAASGSAGE